MESVSHGQLLAAPGFTVGHLISVWCSFCLSLKAQTDFIPPSLWLPNSPDLNPADYTVWGIL